MPTALGVVGQVPVAALHCLVSDVARVVARAFGLVGTAAFTEASARLTKRPVRAIRIVCRVPSDSAVVMLVAASASPSMRYATRMWAPAQAAT